ncbi:MAG: hypothetical protein LBS84_06505, partial [Clostridiales bacterium]|nr:hypothetical protein [Clostridiales bacterium]
MRKLFTAILACIIVISMAACGTTTSTAPADTETPDASSGTPASTAPNATPTGGGKVIVYSALGEADMLALQEKFKADTGIDLEYMIFSAGEGSARVLAEANAPQADIFVGGSMEVYVPLKDAGALYSYTSPNAKDIPSEYADPDG